MAVNLFSYYFAVATGETCDFIAVITQRRFRLREEFQTRWNSSPVLKLLETLRMVHGTWERSSIFHLTERGAAHPPLYLRFFSPANAAAVGCANIISQELPRIVRLPSFPSSLFNKPELFTGTFAERERSRSAERQWCAENSQLALAEYERCYTLMPQTETTWSYNPLSWKSAYLRASSHTIYLIVSHMRYRQMNTYKRYSSYAFMSNLKNSILRFFPGENIAIHKVDASRVMRGIYHLGRKAEFLKANI